MSDLLEEQIAMAGLRALENVEPNERRAWRQYACAALHGLLTQSVSARLDPKTAADYTDEASAAADEMMKLEKKRFEGGV